MSDSPQARVIHEGGVALFADEAFARLLGLPDAASMLGRSLWSFIVPDDVERIGAYAAAISRGDPVEDRLLVHVIRADGRPSVLECGVPVVPWQGRRAIEVLARDVAGPG